MAPFYQFKQRLPFVFISESSQILWSAIGVLFAANIVWSIIFLSTQNSVCDPEQDDIQMCQEQIDRLSYIISLSAEMAVLRKEKGDMKDIEILLRQIVDQITANVIANSIYEFDGKSLVKFDLMNKIFKGLVDAGLIDSEILQSPLGIYEDSKNHKIIHNLYSFNGNTVKKTMTVDECKNFQKWFYDKIVNQVDKD